MVFIYYFKSFILYIEYFDNINKKINKSNKLSINEKETDLRFKNTQNKLFIETPNYQVQIIKDNLSDIIIWNPGQEKVFK